VRARTTRIGASAIAHRNSESARRALNVFRSRAHFRRHLHRSAMLRNRR